MKSTQSFTPGQKPKYLVASFIIALLFSVGVLAQKPDGKDEVRVRYISSAPKKAGKSNGIRIVGKSAGKEVSAGLAKLKADDYQLEKKAFNLINERRVENGLLKLAWSDKAAALARKHSQNMAKHDFFSHVGLNGRMVDRRAVDFGMNDWRSIGENIAFCKGFSNPAEFAVRRWMLSNLHRKNLLHKMWKESGIGIAKTESGKYYFTQIFIVK